MTKEEKRNLAFEICTIILITLGVATSYVFYGEIFGESSIFNQIITQNALLQNLYQKIPSLIKTIQILFFAWVINLLLKLIIKKTLIKNNRGKTIFNLVQSFLKWIIAIIAVLAVLSAWNINTTALIASAGILTLVIGLGAQSLVADIVAGIFIVFEGEYQVGDIVVIENWRGTVTEIGMRVTKIEDAGGNVQIINNSQITKIINQTLQLSVAKSTISVEYGESLPRVEIIIRDHLEEIKTAIPAIIEGPYYKGVNALNTSSVDLLFMAKCKEEDIYQVQRDLNRELKILFDREKIAIPFPQVVVHEPSEKDTTTTKKMVKEAAEFATLQKDLSKDVEQKQ